MWLTVSLGNEGAASQAVPFVAVPDRTSSIGPAKAIGSVSTSQATREIRTNRAEFPFFLYVNTPAGEWVPGHVLEIPSKHVQRIELWLLGDNGRELSYDIADRKSDGKTLTQSGSGFAYAIPGMNNDIHAILIKLSAVGPASLSLRKWTKGDYQTNKARYDRIGSLLLGSLSILATFCGIIAILTRDKAFAICSIWLICSMMSAGLSGGYENTWTPFLWDIGLHGEIKRLLNAAHAISSVYLFDSLFGKAFNEKPSGKALHILKRVVLLLAPAALFLPVRSFLPVMWLIVGIGAPLLLYLLADLAIRNGSIAARWYLMSWGFSLLGVISEILHALSISSLTAFGLNNQTGAVISGLLAGITLSEKLRTERSGRLRAQARTLSVLRKFQDNYNSMPIGLFSATPTGKITLSNPAFQEIFSIPPTGRDDKSFVDLIGRTAFHSLAVASESDVSGDIEIESKEGSGEKRWFLTRVRRGSNSIEGSIQDITRRKKAELQLKHLVTHDSLTNLLNRRGIDAAVSLAVGANGSGKQCAVAYVNLDRFKVINDLHGHGVGDLVLQEIGRRISESIRIEDSVGRIGDSFVLVLVDCPDYATRGLTERVRDTIATRPIEVAGRGISVTVSIGVVELEGSMQPTDAISAADRACAEAKSRGRNCVVVLKDQDTALQRHLEELRMVANLQDKVQSDRYFLEFQPIVALQHAERSLNYEVLIRMRGEDGSVVPPGKFIGAAERNGMMAQIDRWVLRSILEWLDDNPSHRERLSFATINISGASLNDARFVDDAFSMIAEHPMAMPKLCFEITESVALHDLGSTRRFVDRVRLYGAKLALDDFGAGYTSFNYLKEIPADFIKIDGSFVKDINRNPANFSITRTIVDLTHELGMRSIAEWAETADTVRTLIDMGVDYGQGFVLARPMDKRIVTSATSCIDLVRDPDIASMVATPADHEQPA